MNLTQHHVPAPPPRSRPTPSTAAASAPRVLDVSGPLEIEHLEPLLQADPQVLAVRIRGYLSEQESRYFERQLLGQDGPAFERYTFAPKLEATRIGMLYSEACFDPRLRDAYFARATSTERALRDLFAPYLSPIDKLRLDLDALWPAGATVARMQRRRMLSGFIRNTVVNSEITPHQDDLLEESPVPPDFSLTTELVSNVYLSVPPDHAGGELEIYDYRPDYADQVQEVYGQNKDKDAAYLTDAVLEQLTSARSVTLRPERGDLVVFGPKNVHRVHEVRAGSRITSCFHIGFADRHQPLRCWC